MTDVASDNAWELSKENVLPLARGRDVATIRKAFGGSTSAAAPTIDSLKRLHEARIESYEGDDPLQPWLEYIRQFRDACPSDQAEQCMLLEACARTFRGEERYKNDQRYMRVWIEYAGCLTNSGELFKFLYKNGIGLDLAMFWAAWAWVAESSGDYSLADKLFTKAVNRGTDRPQLMKERQQQFTRRMSRLWLKQQSGDDAIDEMAADSCDEALDSDGADGRRMALASLTSTAVELNQRAATSSTQPQPQQTSITAAGDVRRQQENRAANLTRATGGKTGAAKSKKTAGGFAIFVEENFKKPIARAKISRGDDLGGLDAAGEWNDFGTRAAREKENGMEAEKFLAGGVTVTGRRPSHAAAVASAPSGLPSIPVYVEEEFRRPVGGHGGGIAASSVAAGTLKPHQGEMTDAERLAADPLFFMKGGAAGPAKSRSNTGKEETGATTRAVAASSSSSVQQGEEEDMQVEEKRALIYMKRYAAESHARDDTGTLSAAHGSVNPTAVLRHIASSSQPIQRARAPAPTAEAKRLVFPSPAPAVMQLPMPAEVKAPTPKPKTRDNLTINSAAAWDDLKEMFSSPAPAGGSIPADTSAWGRGVASMPIVHSPVTTGTRRQSRERRIETVDPLDFAVYEDVGPPAVLVPSRSPRASGDDIPQENLVLGPRPRPTRALPHDSENYVLRTLEDKPQEDVGLEYIHTDGRKEPLEGWPTQVSHQRLSPPASDDIENSFFAEAHAKSRIGTVKRTNREIIQGLQAEAEAEATLANFTILEDDNDNSMHAGRMGFSIFEDEGPDGGNSFSHDTAAPAPRSILQPAEPSMNLSIYHDFMAEEEEPPIATIERLTISENEGDVNDDNARRRQLLRQAYTSSSVSSLTPPSPSPLSSGRPPALMNIYEDQQMTEERIPGAGLSYRNDDRTPDIHAGPFAAELSRIPELSAEEESFQYNGRRKGSTSSYLTGGSRTSISQSKI